MLSKKRCSKKNQNDSREWHSRVALVQGCLPVSLFPGTLCQHCQPLSVANVTCFLLCSREDALTVRPHLMNSYCRNAPLDRLWERHPFPPLRCWKTYCVFLKVYFSKHRCFACMFVHHVNAVPLGARRGRLIPCDWGYKWLWVDTWMVGIQPRSSGRETGILNHWSISLTFVWRH